jgi:sodium/bile acid cotransporter 7
LLPWIKRNWFLLTLASVFLVGGLAWRTLLPVAESTLLRDVLVAVSMFLMALPLESSAILSTLSRPWAALLAIVVTFGLLPAFAWGLCLVLSPTFYPPEYAMGVLVASVTPCTMASATVWTRKAGGNDTAATVVTVLSNLICFFITPVWLWAMTGQQTKSEVGAFGQMVLRLTITVALPVVLAQLARCLTGVAEFASKQKAVMAIGAQVCILSMVAFGAAKTGQKLSGSELSSSVLGTICLTCFLVLLIHLVMFAVGFRLAKWLGLTWADQVAVGFSGSQKTLMVGMNLSIASGFSVIPMVAYHVLQLFADTFLADWLSRSRSERDELSISGEGK